MNTCDLTHPPRFFIGVDGGGSTTRALVASDDGTIWGYGIADGCNPHESGVAGAIIALQVAIKNAWLDAGISAQPCAGGFLGIAGASSISHEQRVMLTSWLPCLSAARVEVDHDIRIALAGGLSGRPGIAVIAGTGSSGYGRTAAGRTERAGGWGSLLDDAGGGYWLVLRAFRSILRAYDGRGAATLLTGIFLGSLGLRHEGEILEWLRRPNTNRPLIASLTPLVFEAVTQDDQIAHTIMHDGAQELAAIAGALTQRLFPDQSAEVVFAGGLSQVPQYFAAFDAALTSSPLNLKCVRSEHSPLVGAISLAAQDEGMMPSSAWLKAADLKLVKASNSNQQ